MTSHLHVREMLLVPMPAPPMLLKSEREDERALKWADGPRYCCSTKPLSALHSIPFSAGLREFGLRHSLRIPSGHGLRRLDRATAMQ
jgi:hypothetical protein